MRKGQITLFIIIGLIVLIAAGIIFYFVQIKEKKPIEEAIMPVVPVAEADPITGLVISGLRKASIDGLKLIGDQGGYIRTEFTVNPFEPTDAEAVELGRGGVKIPYWWHMKSLNTCEEDCSFDSEKPELYSTGKTNIEDQLAEYIEEHIRDDVDNFAGLRMQGYMIKEKSEPRVIVKVRDNDVFIGMEWKLATEKGETEFEIKDFAATVDVKLKEIYDLATELTNMEIKNTFIENAVKELIYAFARLDERALPPVSDMTIGIGGEKYWIQREVKKKVKEMMQSYISLLQATDTKNFNVIAAPPSAKDPEMYETLYNRQFLIPLEKPHLDLEARFYYLGWWEPYFDLDCDGELCQPDSASSDMGFVIGVQKYNFAYDVSMPVMVEINDPEAFGGQGYSFKFMLEGNLRNNNAFKTDTELLPEFRIGNTSLFCDMNQRTSGDITIQLTDYVTENMIEGASIIYDCGGTACTIGTTTQQKFVSKFPRCLNGVLTLRKLGYAPIHLPLTIDETEQSLKIKMYPKRELKVNARKYLFEKQGINWKLVTSNFYEISEDEDIVITMLKQPEKFEESFSAVADMTKGEETTMKLIPGKYKININGFTTKEIIIPKDKRQTEPEYFLFIEVVPEYTYYVPEEPIVFDEKNPFPSTMAESEFTLTPEKLYNSNEIIIPYFSIAMDKVPEANRKIEDLQQLNNMRAYSRARQDLLKPILR